jgi:hypothetical protein
MYIAPAADRLASIYLAEIPCVKCSMGKRDIMYDDAWTAPMLQAAKFCNGSVMVQTMGL